MFLSGREESGGLSHSWRSEDAHLGGDSSWHATTAKVARCIFHNALELSECGRSFWFFLGQNVTRQQAEKKDLKASQRQKDGRSFHCHTNVNVTSSASWLPHHSIQLLEATAIKLSAMRQFTPPMWQHVVTDGNTVELDKNRYSSSRSLSPLRQRGLLCMSALTSRTPTSPS